MNIFLVSKVKIFESFGSGRLQKSHFEPLISFVELFLAEQYIKENTFLEFKKLIKRNLNFNDIIPEHNLTKEDIIFLKKINISPKLGGFTSKDFLNLSDESIKKFIEYFDIVLFEISEIELKSVLE